MDQIEFLDVLNQDGSFTGESLPRSEVHAKGLWHRSAHIWIVNSKGELLLQKRSMQKTSHPGKWDISAAGHVSAGSTATETALKEIQEELGIEINEEELEQIGTVNNSSVQKNGTYINNEINDIYLLEKNVEIDSMRIQKEEVEEVKYVPWRNVRQMYIDKDEAIVEHPAETKMLFDFLESRYH